MSPKLDVAHHPHLFDLILASADDATLRSFRATSRSNRDFLDARLARHVVHISGGDYTYRGHIWRQDWNSGVDLEVLDVHGGTASLSAEQPYWRSARLVRVFEPQNDRLPSRRALVCCHIDGPFGLDIFSPPIDGSEGEEQRFILNFTYHRNTFPLIAATVEPGPQAQRSVCVIMFTSPDSSGGKMRLPDVARFWGLLRMMDAYTLTDGTRHPSLLSYIFIGTEELVFDLDDVADNLGPDATFDSQAWISDVKALRAERPGTPDFQLMVEAGLSRYYSPEDAETYNDLLDGVFYDTASGFRNRYKEEHAGLIMDRNAPK